MLFQIDEADPRAIYVQIMDEVRRGLITGKLKRGDPLPSVREMAAELSVNPNTVKQAYRELEREGLVEPRRGEGTFVADAARVTAAERRALARGLAERSLWEAVRQGISAEDFLAAAEAMARRRGLLADTAAAQVDPMGPTASERAPGVGEQGASTAATGPDTPATKMASTKAAERAGVTGGAP